ncbi:MAG TPA: ATP-dependent 6-phosphofructokinase [Acetobacteraceae bacterium]|nr:ATP-dependent 6-phosphofructokinase [Acetobacteraceae bacterium]
MRIGVLTSGGDAPGMNAAIRAVVRRALYAGAAVVGIHRGYAGLMTGELTPLDVSSVADIVHRGGTMLLTARSAAFMTPEGLAVATSQAAPLDGLVAIGGDGTLRGAAALEGAGVRTAVVPATIDNDVPCTERSIGFDTAVNTVVQAVDRIRDTATAHERIFVVEVMGRHRGFIALAAGVAVGAESILVPEEPVDLDAICERLERGYARGKRHSIIIAAEGAASGFAIADAIQARTGHEARTTVLGHVQRGGSPTAADRILAARLGEAAVAHLLAGGRGAMMGLAGVEVAAVPYADVMRSEWPLDRRLYETAAVLAI